jgi:hypothetical protein
MNTLPVLLLAVVTTVTWPTLSSLALFPLSIGLGLACLAVLANFSALFPYPVDLESQSGQNPFSGGGGCLTGLANGTLMPSVLALACLPGLLLLGIALWRQLEWLAMVSGIFTLIYGSILFWYGTALAGRLLLQREPEVLQATKPAKEEK